MFIISKTLQRWLSKSILWSDNCVSWFMWRNSVGLVNECWGCYGSWQHGPISLWGKKKKRNEREPAIILCCIQFAAGWLGWFQAVCCISRTGKNSNLSKFPLCGRCVTTCADTGWEGTAVSLIIHKTVPLSIASCMSFSVPVESCTEDVFCCSIPPTTSKMFCA